VSYNRVITKKVAGILGVELASCNPKFCVLITLTKYAVTNAVCGDRMTRHCVEWPHANRQS